MHSIDKQVLDAVRRWAEEGHHFTLITVARAGGSAPRLPGSWLALSGDGYVQDSVSRCFESTAPFCRELRRHR